MTTGSGGTINTNASTTLSYGGVINGSGSISKTGSGTIFKWIKYLYGKHNDKCWNFN